MVSSNTRPVLRSVPQPGDRNGWLVVLGLRGRNRSGRLVWLVHCGRCECDRLLTTVGWRRNSTGMCAECYRHDRHDLAGLTVGRLTVLRPVGVDARRQRLWECACVCGRHVVVEATQLVRRRVRSCGCLRRKTGLAGRRFGRLTVLRELGMDPKSHARMWECACDCGARIVLPASRLTTRPGVGYRSCGCDGLQRVPRADQSLYRKWVFMRRKPHDSRWDDYRVFRRWALSHGYAPGCTIVRPDPSRVLGPGNAYWLAGGPLGVSGVRPGSWKPIRVLRDGRVFAEYRSCSDAARDLMVEEPGRSFGAILLGLRQQANHVRAHPYLGRWTAQWL